MIWTKSASSLVFLTAYSFSIFGCKEYNQPDFGIDHLAMSMCRVISCVVGRGVCYDQCILLAKLPLSCFILYSKAKLVCYSRYLLTSYFCTPVPFNKKDIFLGVLVLEGLVGLHRTVHLQLLQHCWLGHRFGLLWYWMVCLGNKQIILSFLRLHPSTAFWTLLLTMRATPFLLRDSCLQ